MSKFLKLIGFLAVFSMLISTIGYLILPNQIFAYVKDGEDVFVSSFSIFYFSIFNLIFSVISIFYLKKMKNKFQNEEYPLKITIIAFCILILSCLLNFATFLVLNMFLNRIGKPISPLVYRIFFSFIGILSFIYGIYLRKATIKSDFAIKNRWAVYDDLTFKLSNKFSSVVFFVGGIFISVISFFLPSLKQVYFMCLTVLLICGLSSVYISKNIYKKYKIMYRKK